MALNQFFNNFERFDIFQKVQHGTLVHRSSSGLITIFGIIIMVILLFDELSNYFSSQWVSSIGVDTRSLDESKGLNINIDITLPGMTCDQFGLDVADITGDLQLGADRDIKKSPLWTSKKGCRMSGTLKTHRVDGEFHIAFGRIAKASPRSFDSITATQRQVTGHMHQFSPYEMMVFNASHTINHISYGEPQKNDILSRILSVKKAIGSLYGGLFFDSSEHPMDGTEYIVKNDSARIMYFIKVVPTTFIHSDGKVVESYQISHKVQYTPIVYGPVFKQPGIFFRYELSPYHVTSVEKGTTFTHMFSSCCAIVGGVFVVLGFVTDAVNFLIDLLPFNKQAKRKNINELKSEKQQEIYSNLATSSSSNVDDVSNNVGGSEQVINDVNPIEQSAFMEDEIQNKSTYEFTADSSAVSQPIASSSSSWGHNHSNSNNKYD